MKLFANFLLFISLFSCMESKNEPKTTKVAKASHSNSQSPVITIKTDYGDIKFKTFPDKAPNTVKRISQLAKEGFYNGLIFHRVIPRFVIQGGDPTGTGRGGSGQKLKAEFSDLKHKRGTVAMARANDVNSADSQFYISLASHPHLDGKYTIFGEVIEGLEILDKVKQGDKMLKVTVESAN